MELTQILNSGTQSVPQASYTSDLTDCWTNANEAPPSEEVSSMDFTQAITTPFALEAEKEPWNTTTMISMDLTKALT